jgi:hypothetical protein
MVAVIAYPEYDVISAPNHVITMRSDVFSTSYDVLVNTSWLPQIPKPHISVSGYTDSFNMTLRRKYMNTVSAGELSI